jgi:hypothetical protein
MKEQVEQERHADKMLVDDLRCVGFGTWRFETEDGTHLLGATAASMHMRTRQLQSISRVS